jgi:hypothetical protein
MSTSGQVLGKASLREAAVRRTLGMPQEPQWQGTEQELKEYLKAVNNNCTCQFDDKGARKVPCSLHVSPPTQEALDRLLFIRRIAEELMRREFGNAV